MQAIWREKMERGLPIHESIQRIMDKRVHLHPHLEDGWAAFHMLSSSRQSGFARGHIPLSEIAAYAVLYDYEPGSAELEELVWIVQTLDDEYLMILAAEGSKDTPKAEGTRGRNRAASKR